jgi:hypothetical protein
MGRELSVVITVSSVLVLLFVVYMAPVVAAAGSAARALFP